MTGEPRVVIHPNADVLAQAIAARLVTRIVDAQASRGNASVVLTGGGVGTATLSALADAPARDAIDWSRLDVWWGDERFVPTGHPERNETSARDALLDHVPVDPRRVHPMPGPDSSVGDPEAAARAYADELAAVARPEDHANVPTFDVLLLGVGPDGHIASLFPEQPALHEEERMVVGVHGAPKPPPTRLSLTLPAVNSAHEVWLLVAGSEKARACRLALSGAGPVQIPAAGARGRNRTLWLIDTEAAKDLPGNLSRA